MRKKRCKCQACRPAKSNLLWLAALELLVSLIVLAMVLLSWDWMGATGPALLLVSLLSLPRLSAFLVWADFRQIGRKHAP